MPFKKDVTAYLFRPQIKGHLSIHRIGLDIHREINCDDGIDTHARLDEIFIEIFVLVLQILAEFIDQFWQQDSYHQLQHNVV